MVGTAALRAQSVLVALPSIRELSAFIRTSHESF